jgi:hypothetical protein
MINLYSTLFIKYRDLNKEDSLREETERLLLLIDRSIETSTKDNFKWFFDKILPFYKGREVELFEKLYDKYGMEYFNILIDSKNVDEELIEYIKSKIYINQIIKINKICQTIITNYSSRE